MAILETKNLTYTYGVGTPFEKTAVENVNLSVEKGAFVGVIGHTGSGKSTLIQMLNGLIRPHKRAGAFKRRGHLDKAEGNSPRALSGGHGVPVPGIPAV